jgi:hypothetical protein
MPGQILMAAPSAVPGPNGQACYGPVSPSHVAALPAAYLIAWTPPEPAPRPASRPVPIPPQGADRAARYVHNALTDIAAELTSCPPGGRNAAAYTAGLKAGSLLGAARATAGGEQAAAAWTDELAEQALMDAAQRNGYVDKDGEAEALRAIRSGLRNGLRNPRALPDFTAPRPGRISPPRPQADSPRIRANRAAVAANQAYRAGDLDSARQLTEQAAALDPGRAGLWQQHQEQITARRLIRDAQAAHADGNHQRVQELLGQARQLDPRLPAIWDRDLPGLPAARTAHQPREHAVEPGPDDQASSNHVVQDVAPRQQARAAIAPADPKAFQPSWPEPPSRGDTGIPAPRSAERPDDMQRDLAAAPREPETRAGTAGDIRPGAEAADDDPSTRWPAPNPRTALAHGEISRTGNAGSPVASADWRDQLLADVSRPWQPVPGQPRDPSVSVPPERQISRPDIEPDT